MAAANKPIWVQVAEAGFGDRLAELGWKQVSPAHWRLDGDGVIWRTMLGPARKDILKDKLYEDARRNRPDYSELDRMMAGCFEDETGFELVGLDDLIKRVEPGEKFRWMFPMIRRNVKVHLPFSIWKLHRDDAFQKMREWEEANWTLWNGFLEWLGFYDSPPVAELQHVEPAARSYNSYNGGWWDTAQLGVEDVSARLTRHWEIWIRPKVAAWMTAQDVLSWHMFTREDPDKAYNEDVDIYAHYVVGDLDYCRRRLRADANRKVPTLEEELAWLEEVKFFDWRGYDGKTDQDKRDTAQRFIESAARSVEKARHMARALDLKLD